MIVLITAPVVGVGQMLLARAIGVLDPAQDYTAGNDTWPFQQYLLAWYTASTVALAASSVAFVRGPRWQAWSGAVAGAAVCIPIAREWSAGAVAVDDPTGSATRAVLVGLAVGAGGAWLVAASPAVRRGILGWVAITWATTAVATAAERSPTPFGLLPTPRGAAWEWLAWLPPLLMCVVLGAWAAARGDRQPVLGAVAGPLLLAAPSGILARFNGFGGDHYSPATEFLVWLLLSLVGGCVAAGAAALVRARRPSPEHPVARPESPVPRMLPAPTLLRIGGGLLVAAALTTADPSLHAGTPLVAATGALAYILGTRAVRGSELRPLVRAAVAGAAFVAASLVTGWLHGTPSPASLVVQLAIVVAVGWLAGSARAVAVAGLAVVLVSWGSPILTAVGYAAGLGRVLPSLALAVVGAAVLTAVAARTRPAS